MNKLEEYLKDNIERGMIDHVIRARLNAYGKPEFYIQPVDADGEALDFVVEGNYLIRKNESRRLPYLVARLSIEGYKLH